MGKAHSIVEYPIMAYSLARSLGFTIENRLLYTLASVLPGKQPRPPKPDRASINLIQRELNRLFQEDSARIAEGMYPASVLAPEAPWKHLARIPKLAADGVRMGIRRARGKTTSFTDEARDFLSELPRYYRRNFHYQTDGYLSEESAELYEHQVEILFAGSADAMRRLVIPRFKKHFGNTDGKGLAFLEVGAGTGRSTRFMRLAFPKARIVATDLSDPYLKVAQRKLADLQRIDFLQADGAKLPFSDAHFDGAYSVFLFHELPLDARRGVLQEMIRVLKPGGCLGIVDSLQIGDLPELDPFLEIFPQDFHEPFFRNYIENKLEALFEAAGLGSIESGTGFFSKAISATKPA